jgi:hypothetical protein
MINRIGGQKNGIPGKVIGPGAGDFNIYQGKLIVTAEISR